MEDRLVPYTQLIVSFLADKLTFEEFENKYFKLFHSDDSLGAVEEEHTLSDIFTTLDTISDMPEVNPGKATEEELRQVCAAALVTLQSLNAGYYKSFKNDVNALPENLQNFYRMLECAFPEGIPRLLYRPLVTVLGESLSDFELVQLLSHYTGMQDENVLEDAQRARLLTSNRLIQNFHEKLDEVKKILHPCGYGFQSF